MVRASKLHLMIYTKVDQQLGNSTMSRAGATISGTLRHNGSNLSGALNTTGSNMSINSKMPFSFKAALDQIEEEILMLAAEVNYCKKEVQIQKSEQDTIV